MRAKSAPIGSVDLRHATADVVAWGDSDLWPVEIKLDGMTYTRLVEPFPAARQLRLLLRDGGGYVPQPFEQLARIYRDLGHEDDARSVLLAKEKLRHARLRWYGRAWGVIQEVTVGYGYRPLRAGFWLAALLVFGTVVFAAEAAQRTAAAGDQSFSPVIFTLDHLMPVFKFGQGSAFSPTPGTQWIAYGLTAAGWLLATAIATGVARLVNRT